MGVARVLHCTLCLGVQSILCLRQSLLVCKIQKLQHCSRVPPHINEIANQNFHICPTYYFPLKISIFLPSNAGNHCRPGVHCERSLSGRNLMLEVSSAAHPSAPGYQFDIRFAEYPSWKVKLWSRRGLAAFLTSSKGVEWVRWTSLNWSLLDFGTSLSMQPGPGMFWLEF